MPNSKIFSSRSNFFDKRLPELLEREKLRIKVLEEMKKETENENLKECTFKPKITKNFFLIFNRSKVKIIHINFLQSKSLSTTYNRRIILFRIHVANRRSPYRS